jgi:hypothetical protein
MHEARIAMLAARGERDDFSAPLRPAPAAEADIEREAHLVEVCGHGNPEI